MHYSDGKKIPFKFVNESTNANPEYATDGSSGFDLRANLKQPIPMLPLSTHVIPTGLFFEIPIGFEIQIRPRSGLAAKNSITVLNSPGTIDADYRGEVLIILINLSDTTYVVNHGDRIAQGIAATVCAKALIDLTQVDKISTDTVRASDGLGSTGIN